MFCPKSSPSHLYMFQYQYLRVWNPDHVPERSNTCPHSLWWRTPISQFPDFICCHNVFPSGSQRVPIKFPKCSSTCSRSITILYRMVCLKLNFLVCVCVSIYIYLYLSRKVVCFVLWLWDPLNWDASDHVLGVFGKLLTRRGAWAWFLDL
jgi:hypothetical protein